MASPVLLTMDKETFKVLLETQERTQRNAMDLVVKAFQERTKALEETAQELTKSLDFAHAEILDLKRDMKLLQKADTEKQVNIEVLQSTVVELQQSMNYQEDYNRRNNIRITGHQEQPGETWEQTLTSVTKLLEEKLQMSDVKLERAHRVGPATASYPRAIVARFERFGQREATLRNARKLKGTGVYLNEDMCPASLEIKKKKIPQMKKAREEGKIAFFRHTRLIIKEKMGQPMQPANQNRPSYEASEASDTTLDDTTTTESVERTGDGSLHEAPDSKDDRPLQAETVNPAGAALEQGGAVSVVPAADQTANTQHGGNSAAAQTVTTRHEGKSPAIKTVTTPHGRGQGTKPKRSSTRKRT